MRIVAVADTHTFQDDLRVIPDGDVFIHAGDLCRSGRLDELRTVAAWLQALPHRHKVVIAGNHDWCFAREPYAAIAILGEGTVYLQDSEATIEGVRFWGSPWQPAIGRVIRCVRVARICGRRFAGFGLYCTSSATFTRTAGSGTRTASPTPT
jgi:hypothetical protein